VLLRSIKWWLRQRQIPRTKEGGLPTIAWLLLALHTTSHAVASSSEDAKNNNSMEQLIIALAAFFREYERAGALHGTLRFSREAEAESYTSEFRRAHRNSESPWSDLVVLDPAPGAAEPQDVNLAPSLSAATQLLLTYELQRASCLLQGRTKSETSRSFLEALFLGQPPMKNSLPTIIKDVPVTCLLLQGNPSQGVGSLEVVVIERIVPRPGWNAPFLHRFDTTSELHARIFDVCEESGSCAPRKEGYVVLCPCHFVCMIELQRDGNSKYKIKEDDFRIYRTMLRVLGEMMRHQRALGDLPSPSKNSSEQAGDKASIAAAGKNKSSEGVEDSPTRPANAGKKVSNKTNGRANKKA
jgi:hypothetical protein